MKSLLFGPIDSLANLVDHVEGRPLTPKVDYGSAEMRGEVLIGAPVEAVWGGMVSTWEPAESGGGTRLTFVQSGFDTGRPPYGAWAGRLSGVAELRRYHEPADWRPIWLRPDVPGLPEGMLTES